MPVFQTADGRWLVGEGVTEGSDYTGFLGWRDCVIQLTDSEATEKSVDYLNAFRDYALAHHALGQPIMPSSVQVWISNNGTTSAVQADDLSVDGNTFTICGIKWNGDSWDYSNAGQGGGSGSGSGGGVAPLLVHKQVSSRVLDTDFNTIKAAVEAGRSVFYEVTGSSAGDEINGFYWSPLSQIKHEVSGSLLDPDRYSVSFEKGAKAWIEFSGSSPDQLAEGIS